jgi:hypothetical protein
MAEYLQHFLDDESWSQNMGQAEVNLPTDTNGRYRRKASKTKAYKRIMRKLKKR